MDILFLLVPLSVVLVIIIGAVFWYALRSGQFDDMDMPGLQIIADRDLPEPEPASLIAGTPLPDTEL